jgi:LysR family cyn operon transcriptional activator
VTLRQIRYLLAVAEYRSFTRAADALHVSQPALSQQILALERELGAQILDRSGRLVSVTDFGRIYVEHARRALRDLEAAEFALHDVRDLSRGQLRIAYTPTFAEYLVGPLVSRFHCAHPNIFVEMREASLEEIEAALETDAIDLAIGFTDLRSVEIEAEPLFAERMMLVVGSTHPAAHRREPVQAAELAELPFALLTAGFVARYFADRYFKDQGISPPVILEANSISALLKVVREDHLATILPGAMRHEHERFSYIDLDPQVPPRTVALLRRRNAYRSSASLALRETLRSLLASNALSDIDRFDTA